MSKKKEPKDDKLQEGNVLDLSAKFEQRREAAEDQRLQQAADSLNQIREQLEKSIAEGDPPEEVALLRQQLQHGILDKAKYEVWSSMFVLGTDLYGKPQFLCDHADVGDILFAIEVFKGFVMAKVTGGLTLESLGSPDDESVH